MDEEDAEKIAFITPWGTYCYRVMPFSLKNTGATYMRTMTTIFHDMIQREIEIYVDDVIIKSKKQSDHVKDLRKFFQRLHGYNLKLNPAKCAFGVASGKLLGFVVSRHGIELDPSKIKAIQELLPPNNKTELLKKNVVVKWTDECQEAFDKIKRYLSNPSMLVPPEPGRPLILYLTVLDNSFGCVLGQHDITGKKAQAIYYLSKKFTPYEVKYTLLERTCCALTWVAQKLKHYLSSYTTYLISRMDPLKYIFQKPMPTGRLVKWQILLTEFDIIYVTRTAMKAQALADHLADNPVDDEYEPLKTYFPDEEVMRVDEVDRDEKPGWKVFFDVVANMKGVGVRDVLISETGQHYPVTAQLRFHCTNNMVEYEACILGLRLAVDMGVQEILVLGDSDLSVEFKHIPRIHNEIADALATLASMLHHPDKAYVDPVHIQVHDQHAYCNMVKEEIDGEPWFHDVKVYIRSGVYPVHATGDQKRTIRRLASGFFLSGGILYKRTPDLGLLRCIDDKEASTIMAEVHSRVHGDLIHSSPSKLHTMSAPWPFVTWGMDVIGPIESVASNEHRFILVAIDYFTKWVEAVIITDNVVNLNSHLMKEVCQQFKIMHRNSTLYHPKANGAVEAANKNIKKILLGATPYLLVYGTEAVIPAEVEISSLRIVAKAEMARAYNKKAEAKGKFAPNWQGPFIVTRVLPNGALYLTDIEGKCVDMAINSDAVKRGKKFFKSTGTSHGKAWFREQEILFIILKDESMTQDTAG
ncbi:uncharacterized protein [Nicotiana sylvestris]|uniref:uncharacterized protein n=1 Tax=Nicotiana sylvestris TaxID=4096 RepID=UPI00388C6217